MAKKYVLFATSVILKL